MTKLIFLVLISCSLFVIQCSLSYAAVMLDRVVATVNGDVITWSELRRAIEQEDKGILKEFTGKDKKILRAIEKNFLNNMIDLRLQSQEAKKKGLDVRATEMDDAIAEIKKKYNFSDEDFIKTLNAEGFTFEEYKAKLTEQILLSKIVASDVRSGVLVTDKEIEDFYNANKDKYNKGAAVKVRQIFFNMPADEAKKAELEIKAGEIIKRLEAGEDFAKLAGEFSEDISKRFGGDLGYINRGSVFKEMEAAAFSLKEGNTSKPFWSSKGLHIIKVEHRLDLANNEKIKEEIKGILLENAFRVKYEEWIKDLRAKSYIEINLKE
ncbi:MAG: peptidylprolyl isomerase [Nitrospirae bacterium]|nr:peptidylprolyl isomerase [Nitrospirota bacterium]